jgi:hypothetical protein
MKRGVSRKFCTTQPRPRSSYLLCTVTHRSARAAVFKQQVALLPSPSTRARRLAILERSNVDMSLLASVLLTPDAVLWTVDKNLDTLAARLGVAFGGVIG